MHYLTPAEQERLAYAEGYTETAAVLARLDDAHRALGNEATMQLAIDDLEAQVAKLEDERDAATDLAETLRADLIESAHRVGQLREELDVMYESYVSSREELEETREEVKRLNVAVRMSLEYLTDIVEGAGSPFYNKAGAADMLRAVLLEALE